MPSERLGQALSQVAATHTGSSVRYTGTPAPKGWMRPQTVSLSQVDESRMS